MTREDLFQAIGQVEEHRLARCDAPSGIVRLEGDDMENKTRKRPAGRMLRNVLVAAVVVALLAVGVFASWDVADDYGQYLLHENPRPIIEAAFGENGMPYYNGNVSMNPNEVNATYEYAFERVAVDGELAEKYLNPYCYAVNEGWEERITSKLNGFENVTTMTVEANLFDASTGCGVLYYVLEDNVGVDYRLLYDGTITGGDVLVRGYAEEYADAAQTTNNRLCVAVHYITKGNMDCVELQYVGGKTITVPLIQREMQHITICNGKVIVSPIGMRVEDSVAIGCENMDCIDEVIIQFTDGTEYLLFGEREGMDCEVNNLSYALSLGGNYRKVVYAFNRIVDVENMAAVVVNGSVFPIE